MHFYELEPWGFPVQDLWHGVLTSTVANAAGAKLEPKTFMLGEKFDPTDADQVDFLRNIFPGFSPPPGAPPPSAAADGPRTEPS